MFIKGFKQAFKGHINSENKASRDGDTKMPSMESKASVDRVNVVMKFVRIIKPRRIVTDVDFLCDGNFLADIRNTLMTKE